MLNNIIGVNLDGTPGPDIAWTADAEGFNSLLNLSRDWVNGDKGETLKV